MAGGAAEALGGEVVTVGGSSGTVHQCGTLGWVSVSIGTTCNTVVKTGATVTVRHEILAEN